MKSKQTRVVLADDHAKVRSGIRNLLTRAPDITIIGEASNGLEAIHLVETLSPDILLLDMEMPVMDGTQVAFEIKRKGLPVKILALSAYDDRQYVLNMLNTGAAGYLVKEDVPEILLKAIRGIAHGERGWISEKVANLISTWSDQKDDQPDSEVDT